MSSTARSRVKTAQGSDGRLGLQWPGPAVYLEIGMLDRLSLTLLAFSAVTLFAGAPEAIGQQDTAAAEIHRLFADEWDRRLQRDPLFASSRGLTEYNDRLPDVTADAQQRALEEDLQFLERLEAIDRAALSPNDQTNHDLFEFVVGHRANLATYRVYRMPFTSDSGFHIRIQRMYEYMPFRSVEDYETYLTRLSAVGPYFEQNIANMRDGVAEGFTQPGAILNGIVPSISGAIVDSPERQRILHPVARHSRVCQCRRRGPAAVGSQCRHRRNRHPGLPRVS